MITLQGLPHYPYDHEVIVDLLLVIANKPVSYANLQNFSLADLWRLASNFVRQRHAGITESQIERNIESAKKFFDGLQSKVDILTFEGEPILQAIPDPSPAPRRLYYQREQSIQDFIFACNSRWIYDSFFGLLLKKLPVVQEILELWITQMVGKDMDLGRLFNLDMQELRYMYEYRFCKRMGNIDKPMVIDTLIKARLAYVVDGDMLCPFWYTMKKSHCERYSNAFEQARKAIS